MKSKISKSSETTHATAEAVRSLKSVLASNMTEEDVLEVIRDDKWMMDVLRIAEKLNLPNWIIGAGFVRNKVWDYLHGFRKPRVDTGDIDLIYYDPNGNDETADKKLSEKLKSNTNLNWEVVNEVYAHRWYSINPPTVHFF